MGCPFADAGLPADRTPGVPLGAQGCDSGSFHGDPGPSYPLSLGPRIPDTGANPLSDQATLKFRHGALALDPFRSLLISLAGWMNQRQQDALDYRQEENRVLREQLGGKRLRLSDDQRLRLAVEPRNWAGVCCRN